MSPEEVINRMAALRVSNKQLATRLGVPHQTVSAWRTGRIKILKYEALALSQMGDKMLYRVNMSPREIKAWQTEHNVTDSGLAAMLGVDLPRLAAWKKDAHRYRASALVREALRILSNERQENRC